MVFNKIHIPVEEMLFKSILKGKISKIYSLSNYHFALMKAHKNESKFLTDIYNGKCLHLLTIQNSLGIPYIIFQRYHPGYFMDDAMQNFYFGICIDT